MLEDRIKIVESYLPGDNYYVKAIPYRDTPLSKDEEEKHGVQIEAEVKEIVKLYSSVKTMLGMIISDLKYTESLQ